MRMLAITKETCSWLLAHPSVLGALHDAVVGEDLNGLTKAEFASGPLRMAGSEDARVLAIWNREYLSGTGVEQWAILTLDEERGLKRETSISRKVFERMVVVANQRLQGLVLDGEFIHRTWPNGSHTCLAGRGQDARQFSIAYFEGGAGFADLSARSIFILGPEHDFDALQAAIDQRLKEFAPAANTANRLIDPQRRRPILEAPALPDLRMAVKGGVGSGGSLNVKLASDSSSARSVNPYETLHWDYSRWLQSGALNDTQRRVVNSDILARHPLRIIGPAGSGKTLLMQLLALKYLEEARNAGRPAKALYVVHNSAMAQMVSDRFHALGADEFLTGHDQSLSVSTLSEYGRNLIGLSDDSVVDKDAEKTKQFQREAVQEALRISLNEHSKAVEKSSLLSQVKEVPMLFELFSILVMAEISSVIKGRGLTEDGKRYVSADTPLSRLHRILSQEERQIVFDTYQKYHHTVFEQYEMLDSDDIALSLAGRLRTPVWKLKRRAEGFDVVFVDEAQLFNENERRIFPYLTRGQTAHVPIALALDEAQEPFGFASAGLATLGIEDAENEELPINHRSTREIVDLALFVIQRTTDLFGTEFPEFKDLEIDPTSDSSLASSPVVVRCNEEAPSFAKFVLRSVQKLRAKNVRQIAVICHADTYWQELEDELRASQIPLHVITQRGEKLSPDQPLVVLSRPSYVGGQEFDAVLLVGLEQGVMPPNVPDNPALSAALEQQVLRELYLAVTRARYRLVVLLNKRASANSIIEEATSAHLLKIGSID